MRSQLLFLLPLLGPAAATFLKSDSDAESESDSRASLGTLMALCEADIPRGTLWIADDKAYTCAPFTDTSHVASVGDYCISATTAELSGGEDRCGSHSDCGTGGYCVELPQLSRVCWRLTWDKRCANVGGDKGLLGLGL